MKRILAAATFVFGVALVFPAIFYLTSLGQFGDVPLGLALLLTASSAIGIAFKLLLTPLRRVSVTLDQNQLAFLALNGFVAAFACLYELYQVFAFQPGTLPWQVAFLALLFYGLPAVLFVEFATDCWRVRNTDALRTGRVTFAWAPVQIDVSRAQNKRDVKQLWGALEHKTKGKRAKRR